MSGERKSDYNMQKINTKEFEDLVRANIDFGGNIMVIAQRGSGKTMISKDVIQQSKYKEVYLNLSVLERTDLQGFPRFFDADTNRKFVNYLLPAYFQPLIEGNVPCVALLDEIDKAESQLWGPMLEFTQFRTINGVDLPNLKAIIMTGNLQSEGGQRPSSPLLDRAQKYLLEPNHRMWLDWAGRGGEIHPSVSAFIADNPGDLFGEADIGENYADPTPRGWHNASKILFHGEKHHWSSQLMSSTVAGYVGKKTGIKYSSYFEHYHTLLPLVERIMAHKDVIEEFKKLKPGERMVAAMITCARLARILDETGKDKKLMSGPVRAVAKFFSDNVDPEMVLISVRSQIGVKRVIDNSLTDDEHWDKILKDLARRAKGDR